MRTELKCRLISYMSQVERLMAEQGVSISISTDFEQYRLLRKQQVERHADRSDLAPIFDAKMGFIPSGTGFWVKAEKDGEVVHSQAVRLHDGYEESLYDHIRNSRLAYVPPEIHDLDTYHIRIPERMRQMTGRLTYHGDAWIANSLRNTEANLVLGRYGLAAAKIFWDVDYYFAFMSNTNVFRGLHTRAGLFHADPAIWMLGDDALCRYNLVWIDREGVDVMIETPPAELTTKKKPPREDSTIQTLHVASNAVAL